MFKRQSPAIFCIKCSLIFDYTSSVEYCWCCSGVLLSFADCYSSHYSVYLTVL